MKKCNYFEAMGKPVQESSKQTKELDDDPLADNSVDIKKAKELNNGIDQSMYAATPPLEVLKLLSVKLAARQRERRDTKIARADDNSSVIIHVDTERTSTLRAGRVYAWRCRMRIKLRKTRCVGALSR